VSSFREEEEGRNLISKNHISNCFQKHNNNHNHKAPLSKKKKKKNIRFDIKNTKS
jgi:hypothetical protein